MFWGSRKRFYGVDSYFREQKTVFLTVWLGERGIFPTEAVLNASMKEFQE
jgi:hypothetical protein